MSNLHWMQDRTSTFARGDGSVAWAHWGFDIGMPSVTSSSAVAAVLPNRATAGRRRDGRRLLASDDDRRDRLP
jgi:hypothetical protein